MIYIYGLVCPIEEVVRYVGLTRNLDKRIAQHFRALKHGHNKHKKNWILKLRKINKVPYVVILGQTMDSGEADRLERQYISSFNTQHSRLLNLTSGGEGNFVPTEAARENIRQGAKGRKGKYKMTEEHKQKIAEGNRGRDNSYSGKYFTAYNKSRVGIPLTEAHKAKVSAALKGRKPTQEQKERTRIAIANYYKDPANRAKCKVHAPLLARYRAEALAKAAKVRREKAKPTWDKVVELKAQGLSNKKIGPMVGISPQQVGKLLKILEREKLSVGSDRQGTIAES